jgi:hypothetical protein
MSAASAYRKRWRRTWRSRTAIAAAGAAAIAGGAVVIAATDNAASSSPAPAATGTDGTRAGNATASGAGDVQVPQAPDFGRSVVTWGRTLPQSSTGAS